jgi:hypothetical protein
MIWERNSLIHTFSFDFYRFFTIAKTLAVEISIRAHHQIRRWHTKRSIPGYNRS